MKRALREQLNLLSKKVFGTSSKWKKLVDKGVAEPYERDREVMVPRANGSFAKKVFTDKKSVTKRYTVDEVFKIMMDVLAARNASKVKPDEVAQIEVGSAKSESEKALDELAVETESLGLEFK